MTDPQVYQGNKGSSHLLNSVISDVRTWYSATGKLVQFQNFFLAASTGFVLAFG
jgi:hypothetical protein